MSGQHDENDVLDLAEPMTKALNRMLACGFGSGEHLRASNPAQKAAVIAALAKAGEIWPVVAEGEGFLLQWNLRYPRADATLTPAMIRALALAVETLNDAGVKVRRGQSARGYTYLNIDVQEALDTEEANDEGEPRS